AGIALVIVGFLSRHPDQKPGLFDGLGVLDVAGWLLLITGILSIASALVAFLSEYREQRSFTFSPQGKLSLEIVVAFGVFFMLLPGFVYFLTYVPMLLNHPSTQAMGDVGWTGLGQVVRQNRMAYDFHQSLRSPHPYSSTWDSWPIMARPVYFYAGDHNAKIYALGNPAVFWASLPALAFAIRALAVSVDSLWRREEPWGRYAAAGFLVVVALTFAFFYPHLTAIPVANWLDKLYFPFDRGNLLDNDLFNWE